MAVLDLTTELLTQIRDGLQESRAELRDTRLELLKRIDQVHGRVDDVQARLDQTRTDLLDTIVDTRAELGEGIERLRHEIGQLVGHVVTLADRVLRLEAFERGAP